jgi:hypothetical protein
MTVTLSPELADLLGKTGHSWPDADEDRIVAMADGWNGLHTRLAAVRGDHNDSAQSIMARNTGEGTAAFGEWVNKLDDVLLVLVEICARAEALLLAIARAVLAVKKAIIDALDALARAIDKAKRGMSKIPVVGGVISKTIEEVIEPLVNAAREVITEILNKIADLVVEQIVPKLTEFIEIVKGLVQKLRKLIKGESGADWPTEPSGEAHPENTPRGRPETWTDRDDEATQRARRLENEAAATLAQAGYDVEQNPSVPGTKNPDYKIEGKVFDCVAPTSANPYSIWSNVKKNKIDKGQTERVVINIDAPDAQVDVNALRKQFQDHPMPGLKEVKVIGAGGAVIDIYP